MADIGDLYSMVSKLFHEKIKKFSRPLLDHLRINHFYHYKISNAGLFSCMGGLNRELEEEFFSSKDWYKWSHYRNPVITESGVWQINAIDDQHMQKFFKLAQEKYNVNYSLLLIDKTTSGMDAYGFGLNSKDPFIHMSLINELPLIRLFIKCFKEEFSRELNVLNELQINVAKLLGPSTFNTIPFPGTFRQQICSKLMKKMRIELPTPLTSREMDIAQYLIKGYYASQIAEDLFISKRTVEHHLERMKDKFCCSSKSALIQKILEYQSIGYLVF